AHPSNPDASRARLGPAGSRVNHPDSRSGEQTPEHSPERAPLNRPPPSNLATSPVRPGRPTTDAEPTQPSAPPHPGEPDVHLPADLPSHRHDLPPLSGRRVHRRAGHQ